MCLLVLPLWFCYKDGACWNGLDCLDSEVSCYRGRDGFGSDDVVDMIKEAGERVKENGRE